MPILPPITAQPQDSVTSVLNAARVRVNDELKTLHAVSGKLLKNNAPFTQQVVNNAWRKTQECLANHGYTDLKQEQVIYGLPPVATSDPGVFTYIDWFNYFDGVNLYPAPVLPSDLLIPLKIWERPSGQNAVFPQNPMEIFYDGLPANFKGLWNQGWEWRAQQVWLPGAQQTTDLRVLYMKVFPDFADSGTTQWFQQSVPLVRSQNAFSEFICAEIAETLSELDQESWIARAETSCKQMCNRNVAMKQRGNTRRMSRSGRLENVFNGY